MITSILERQVIAAVSEADNFTVNTGVTSVVVAPGNTLVLYDNPDDLDCWLTPNEGALIQNIYFRMPYQFTMAAISVYIRIFAEIEDGGGTESFAELTGSFFGGTAGVIENNLIPINTFVSPPAGAVTLNSRWRFQAGINTATFAPRVSMINCPAALNAVQLPIIVGAQILHSYALTPDP